MTTDVKVQTRGFFRTSAGTLLALTGIMAVTMVAAGCHRHDTHTVTRTTTRRVYRVSHHPIHGIHITGLRISIILIGGQYVYLPDGHYRHHVHNYTIIVQGGRVVALDRFPPGLWVASTRPGRRRGRPFRGGRYSVAGIRVHGGHLTFYDLDDGSITLPAGDYKNEHGDVVAVHKDGIATFGAREEVFERARRNRPAGRSASARGRGSDEKPGSRWTRGEKSKPKKASGRPSDAGAQGRDRADDARDQAPERAEEGRSGRGNRRERAEKPERGDSNRDSDASEGTSGERKVVPVSRDDRFRRAPGSKPAGASSSSAEGSSSGQGSASQGESGAGKPAVKAEKKEESSSDDKKAAEKKSDEKKDKKAKKKKKKSSDDDSEESEDDSEKKDKKPERN